MKTLVYREFNVGKVPKIKEKKDRRRKDELKNSKWRRRSKEIRRQEDLYIPCTRYDFYLWMLRKIKKNTKNELIFLRFLFKKKEFFS